MVKRKMFVVLGVISAILLVGSVLAQDKKKCMFISAAADPHPNDVILVGWLEEKYEVDIVTGADVKANLYTIDDFKQYDFVFVSESISSSDAKPLKGAPVPIFYTELWCSKWDVTGWVPSNISGTYYENSPEKVVKIVNGDHPLAAGFATGTEITICTGTSDPNGAVLTYSVPQVDHIKIAILAANETRVVVMGVEKGTVLYNAENIKDGSLVSESRCAAVGINATANNFITDEAFTLIDAGINWILETETAVEQEEAKVPLSFELGQNYPNPFNPTTSISLTLEKSAHTTLVVYNLLGQVIATPINEFLEQGTHSITFDAHNLPSGVYFYQVHSGEFSQTKKMMVLK